jgi:adenine-specific DNA-methyltransferase
MRFCSARNLFLNKERNIKDIMFMVSTASILADHKGLAYSGITGEEHKKVFGQYLTPPEVAVFMSRLASNRKEAHLRILDPGMGSGILGITLVERIIISFKSIKSIHLTGYEIDSGLKKIAQESLDHLKIWANTENVIFTYEIRVKDFVLDKAFLLDDSPSLLSALRADCENELFDIVISNPPYFKISKDDPRARAAAKVVYGQPNIYALFMAISAKLLNNNGELIFITPRSYASGPYFKSFREFFFNEVTPVLFHLFNSRTEAFDRDAILQENLILYAKRTSKNDSNKNVKISYSNGSRDLEASKCRMFPLKRLIDILSLNKVLFLPTTDEDDRILQIVNSWSGSLHKYEMEISTGKVVPFRATEFLSEQGDIRNGEAPLIWMNSIRNSNVIWPFKKRSKPQYIRITAETRPLLNPNGNYVLLRRFSAKEEFRRLNSSPYLQEQLPCNYIAFENHVNYVHRPHGKIGRTEAIGISAILNSLFLDTYFRVSNGNTQVSATEIRDMPLPEMHTIRRIGELLGSDKEINVDAYLEKHAT